jgi:hypothetical protein
MSAGARVSAFGVANLRRGGAALARTCRGWPWLVAACNHVGDAARSRGLSGNLRSLVWWGDDLMDWPSGRRVTSGSDVQPFGVGSTSRVEEPS